MTFADGTVEFGFDGGVLDQPTTIKRTPAGGGTAEQQAFAFDGALTTGLDDDRQRGRARSPTATTTTAT